MKALTLTQPWASLMAFGEKNMETRTWFTAYRGELVIHAAKSFPLHYRILCSRPEFRMALRGAGVDDLPLGVGLCVVRLLGCVKTTELHKVELLLGRRPAAKELLFGDYSPGRYAWVTELVRPLAHPVAVRGSLGLWEWPQSGQETDQEKAENALLRGEAHL
jgi:activating signal cointegrator 1